MSIKELIDKIREGDLTPVEVYEDFYKDWSDDRRWELECSLMAVIVTERCEGRWTSSAHKYCSNCYGYLQMRRQEDTTAEEKQSSSEPDIPDTNSDPSYNSELVRLFHGHTELINKLVTLTDDEKVKQITEWSKEADPQNKKKKLIDNPCDYGNATKYANALKAEDLIASSADRFRRKF